MKWTEEVEKCFEMESPSDSLLALLQLWNKFISDLAELCQTEESLTVHRGLLASLLTQDVHCRDVIQLLINDKINTFDNFQWIRYTYCHYVHVC